MSGYCVCGKKVIKNKEYCMDHIPKLCPGCDLDIDDNREYCEMCAEEILMIDYECNKIEEYKHKLCECGQKIYIGDTNQDSCFYCSLKSEPIIYGKFDKLINQFCGECGNQLYSNDNVDEKLCIYCNKCTKPPKIIISTLSTSYCVKCNKQLELRDNFNYKLCMKCDDFVNDNKCIACDDPLMNNFNKEKKCDTCKFYTFMGRQNNYCVICDNTIGMIENGICFECFVEKSHIGLRRFHSELCECYYCKIIDALKTKLIKNLKDYCKHSIFERGLEVIDNKNSNNSIIYDLIKNTHSGKITGIKVYGVIIKCVYSMCTLKSILSFEKLKPFIDQNDNLEISAKLKIMKLFIEFRTIFANYDKTLFMNEFIDASFDMGSYFIVSYEKNIIIALLIMIGRFGKRIDKNIINSMIFLATGLIVPNYDFFCKRDYARIYSEIREDSEFIIKNMSLCH